MLPVILLLLSVGLSQAAPGGQAAASAGKGSPNYPYDYRKWHYCNGHREEPCDNKSVPICGVGVSRTPRQYPNMCYLCKDKTLLGYQEGICRNLTRYCSRKFCNETQGLEGVRPACAFFNYTDYKEVDSRFCCNRTAPRRFQYLILGPCPRPSLGHLAEFPERRACESYMRRADCSNNSRPVCGFHKDNLTKTDFVNECQACLGYEYVSYSSGECALGNRFSFCPQGYSNASCEGLPDDPVCAFPYFGLPEDFRSPCGLCNTKRYSAYRKGKCSSFVKTCPPKVDGHCKTWPEIFPSCAFRTGERPYEVMNDSCCVEIEHEQVMVGQCPIL